MFESIYYVKNNLFCWGGSTWSLFVVFTLVMQNFYCIWLDLCRIVYKLKIKMTISLWKLTMTMTIMVFYTIGNLRNARKKSFLETFFHTLQKSLLNIQTCAFVKHLIYCLLQIFKWIYSKEKQIFLFGPSRVHLRECEESLVVPSRKIKSSRR